MTAMMLAIFSVVIGVQPLAGEQVGPNASKRTEHAHACLQPKPAPDDASCSWVTHKNSGWGVEFKYPTTLFVQLPISARGVSETFLASGGKMYAAVWGEVANHVMKPSEAMATDIYNIGLGEITSQNAGDVEYTLFGTHGSRSLLKRRVYLGSDPHVSATICITWPANANEEWAALAFRIASTLRLTQDEPADTLRRGAEDARTGYRCEGL